MCNLWELPPLSKPTPSINVNSPLPPAKRARKDAALDAPRHHALDGVEKPLPWQLQGRRLCFVVDCKPLQQVSCGLSPLLAANLKVSFETITQNLSWALEKGWLARRAWDDPVLWRRRSENVIADYLANHTMNIGKSWFEAFDWPFEGRLLKECNLLAHCDGGSRRQSCSASAWVVEACIFQHGQWLRKPLAMSGTYFDQQISSFTAETLALEDCTCFIKRLLERGCDNEALGKRSRLV